MVDIVRGIAVGRKEGILEKFSHEIRSSVSMSDWFRNASDVYDSVAGNPPDLIVLDLSEEEEDRLNLAAGIAGRLSGVVLIALSQDPSSDLVIKAFRAGVTDFIPWPAPSGEALSVVRRLFDPVSPDAAGKKIYSLFSLKGGQGVTTISLNLTDHIRKLTGKNVLLFDMNFYNGDLAGKLKSSPTYTPFDLQRDLKRLDRDLLFSTLPRHERGFHILPCPEEISDAEEIKGEDLREILSALAAHMDYLLIDLPHDLSSRTLAALEASQTILLIFQDDIGSIKSVLRVLRFFREIGQAEDKIRLILNRYCRRGDLAPEDYTRIFERPLFHVLNNNYRAVMKSINEGVTLDAVNAGGSFNLGVRSLAAKLTGTAVPVSGRFPWIEKLKGNPFRDVSRKRPEKTR